MELETNTNDITTSSSEGVVLFAFGKQGYYQAAYNLAYSIKYHSPSVKIALFVDDIKKLEDGFKSADGAVKMKLFKVLIDKMGCTERPVYYLSGNGNIFNYLPERDFFRTNYDDLKIKFDYHVNFSVSEEEENNDFKVKMILGLDDKKLLEMTIVVKFSHEMSGRLTAKYKFDLSSRFNYMISTKKTEIRVIQQKKTAIRIIQQR
jgi:hypothetical protein